jgi:hypothetical protein
MEHHPQTDAFSNDVLIAMQLGKEGQRELIARQA